ncbi:Uncharacterised protein r2_g329 [Pycnogonum litorale]
MSRCNQVFSIKEVEDERPSKPVIGRCEKTILPWYIGKWSRSPEGHIEDTADGIALHCKAYSVRLPFTPTNRPNHWFRRDHNFKSLSEKTPGIGTLVTDERVSRPGYSRTV